jgi:prevent-host-death family protein
MNKIISKSQFKPKALHYFRIVEQSGKELIISDHGKPVLKIVPYQDQTDETMKGLRNTVKHFVDPTQPVGLEDWNSLK